VASHPSEHSSLTIRNLCVHRGTTEIIRDLDWTVRKGEHWAILGANGSGKTSLLAAITAYLSPNAGSIQLLGETYGQSNWIQLRERIGMVSSALTRRVPADELAIETVLSGEKAQLGYWAQEDRIDAGNARSKLRLLGVDYAATRPWRVLSQGERQKVFIARALMANPALLILDEPCAGLDPVAREQFLQSLSTLAHEQAGVNQLLVTHHVEEIIPEITHVLLLKKGRALAAGPKGQVLRTEPLSEAFEAPIEIHCDERQRYQLQVQL